MKRDIALDDLLDSESQERGVDTRRLQLRVNTSIPASRDDRTTQKGTLMVDVDGSLTIPRS